MKPLGDGSDGDLVLLSKSKGASRPVALQIGAVHSLATQPSLRSCNFLLADRPAATAFLASAENALTAADYAKPAELRSPLEAFISNDPLNRGDVIVTVNVSGPVEQGIAGIPSGVVVRSTLSYAVLERISDHAALEVGIAPWS